jgi:hypothetical protein
VLAIGLYLPWRIDPCRTDLVLLPVGVKLRDHIAVGHAYDTALEDLNPDVIETARRNRNS